MKIKTDFITNSSSETFVVMGVYFDINSLTEKHMDKIKKIINNPDLTIENIYHYIYVLFEGTGLKYSSGDPNSYDNDIMIGIHYTDMMENETLKQFRKRVERSLKTSLDLDLKAGHIEVGWENR